MVFFLRKPANVATTPLRIFTLLLPTVPGVVLDALRNQKVPLFHHINTADFSSVLMNAVSVTLVAFLII